MAHDHDQLNYPSSRFPQKKHPMSRLTGASYVGNGGNDPIHNYENNYSIFTIIPFPHSLHTKHQYVEKWIQCYPTFIGTHNNARYPLAFATWAFDRKT